MSEFQDLEGPRRNNYTVHLVQKSNKSLTALTSRVEARDLKKTRNYKTTWTIETQKESHIGDVLWIVLNQTGEPTKAYHDKSVAQEKIETNESLVRSEIKSWDVTKNKLYPKESLKERREKGFI